MSTNSREEEVKLEDDVATTTTKASNYLQAAKKSVDDAPVGAAIPTSSPSASHKPPTTTNSSKPSSSSTTDDAEPASSSGGGAAARLKSQYASRTPTVEEEEDEEEATKVEDRRYPVSLALAEGAVAGWLLTWIVFSSWWFWVTLLTGFAAASVASREDVTGRKARRQAERLAEISHSSARAAYTNSVHLVKNAPHLWKEEKARLVAIDDKLHVSKHMGEAYAKVKAVVEPAWVAVKERVHAADSKGIIPKAQAALWRADKALGLTRTTGAVWGEIKAREEKIQ